MTKTDTLNRDFLLGGKASFVFQNPQGIKFEFSVRKSKPKPNSRYGPSYFVSLRDPKHPQQKYGNVYMGILNTSSGTIKTTYASVYKPDDTAFMVAQWAINLMWSADAAPDGYTLTHTGKCGRCGRKLTDVDSIARGIGPECIKMINANPARSAPKSNVKYNPSTGYYQHTNNGWYYDDNQAEADLAAREQATGY